MQEFRYLGIVKYQGKWRIYGDDTIRKTWAIDLRKISLNEVPHKRRQLLYVDKSNIEGYCKALDAEIFPDDIIQNPATCYPTFVIDFDSKLFVDSGGEDSFFLAINHLIPSDWTYLRDFSRFYIPEHISKLWLRARIEDESKTIWVSPITTLGVVHFESKWRFYGLQHNAWILDHQSYMNKSHPDWFTNPIYSEFRKQLPIVDATNTEIYIKSIKGFEIPAEEIKRIRFALPEDIQFNIDVSKEQAEGLEKSQRDNWLAFVEAHEKPQIQCLIDFDSHRYVKNSLKAIEINSSEVYAPPNWTCYLDSPMNYLPENLFQIIS